MAEKTGRAGKKEFDEDLRRLCVPWNVTPTGELARDYYGILSDLGTSWLRAGADRLLRIRRREQGFPTPGDWREAAEFSRAEHYRKPDGNCASSPEPLGREGVPEVLLRLMARVKNPAFRREPSPLEREARWHFQELLHKAQGVNPRYAMGPLVSKVLSDLGGPEALKILDSDTVVVARDRFVELYVRRAENLKDRP